MNARSHHFQLVVDERQMRDAVSAVFHTILFHRSTPKMHYTSESNFQLGSIGIEEVDCTSFNLSYIRINSPTLVSRVQQEIDGFVQDVRKSTENITGPRYYSPPPSSSLSYGSPLLNAKVDLEFFQRKKRSWLLTDYQVPWEIWHLHLNLIRVKEHEYLERMHEEAADAVSEIIFKICSQINRPQYMPQMPLRSEAPSVFDTTFPDCQPYLFRLVKHPLDPGENAESTIMNVGASAVKKMLKDTFLA